MDIADYERSVLTADEENRIEELICNKLLPVNGFERKFITCIQNRGTPPTTPLGIAWVTFGRQLQKEIGIIDRINFKNGVVDYPKDRYKEPSCSLKSFLLADPFERHRLNRSVMEKSVDSSSLFNRFVSRICGCTPIQANHQVVNNVAKTLPPLPPPKIGGGF